MISVHAEVAGCAELIITNFSTFSAKVGPGNFIARTDNMKTRILNFLKSSIKIIVLGGVLYV